MCGRSYIACCLACMVRRWPPPSLSPAPGPSGCTFLATVASASLLSFFFSAPKALLAEELAGCKPLGGITER